MVLCIGRGRFHFFFWYVGVEKRKKNLCCVGDISVEAEETNSVKEKRLKPIEKKKSALRY